MIRDYKKIDAFQLADELVLDIYSATKNLPKSEMFGLISQIRRAAVSVPANIVEGSRRASKKEYLQFLHIAQGSLSEVEYYVLLSNKLGFLNDDQSNRLAESFLAPCYNWTS